MIEEKQLDILKGAIRKQISEAQKDERPKSMHELAVDLTKSASEGLKALEALKSKVRMPSRRADASAAQHIRALESLFNDIWQSPLSYLDSNPDDVVNNRRAQLAAREKDALVDGVEREVNEIFGFGKKPSAQSTKVKVYVHSPTIQGRVQAKQDPSSYVLQLGNNVLLPRVKKFVGNMGTVTFDGASDDVRFGFTVTIPAASAGAAAQIAKDVPILAAELNSESDAKDWKSATDAVK